MTLEQMPEFVEVAVGFSPNKGKPHEAKHRFIAVRGLVLEYVSGAFGRLCENVLRAISGHVELYDAKARCRVENPTKGLAESHTWENCLPFITGNMVSGSSWDNRECVEAEEVDDGQLRKAIGLVDDIASKP